MQVQVQNLKVKKIISDFFPGSLFYPSESKRWFIGLHGRGDQPASFSFLRHHLRLQEINQIWLAAPDPWIVGGSSGFSWYLPYPDHTPGIERSFYLLSAFLESLRDLGIVERQVFLLGFSQGSQMALHLGLRHSVPVCAVAGISGIFYDPEMLVQKTLNSDLPVLLTHGWQDNVLKWGIVSEQIETIQKNCKNLKFHSLSKGHYVDSVEYSLIHTWMLKAYKDAGV